MLQRSTSPMLSFKLEWKTPKIECSLGSEEILVDMLLDIAPGYYNEYVTTDKKGVKQLIVESQNAIYGTMVASLLYYKKFCKSLKREVF